MSNEVVQKTAKAVVNFLDEEDELNAFAVGLYSAFKKLKPGQKATGLPLNMVDDAKREYKQYYVGFYAMRIAQAVVVIAMGYFGLA